MNWLEIVNNASEYIESHITEDIDLTDIAKHCNVSYSYFANVFPMITGYSLKEYIRNRRMTMASYEVANTDNRILDIALKYCYGSNEAFSRAFRQTHGMNPSEARKQRIKTFIHFPSVMYDIPKLDVLHISYRETGPKRYRFKGIHQFVVESKDTAAQRSRLDNDQIAFIHSLGIDDPFAPSPRTFKVKYNINSEKRQYDLLFALDADETHIDRDDLTEVVIDHHRYLEYEGIGESVQSIRTMKQMIIDDWDNIQFDFAQICEIEFVEKTKDNLYRLIWILSVK